MNRILLRTSETVKTYFKKISLRSPLHPAFDKSHAPGIYYSYMTMNDSQIHNYSYRIHSYSYTVTVTQIQIHSYKYTDTDTQIQICR